MTNKEPLALWFPELNSLQLAKLRQLLREAAEYGTTEPLDICSLCGATPMTVNCNNAGCS